MEDMTNKLIQAYDRENETIGLFRITGNNCPEDHINTVIEEYFDEVDEDEDNADLNLMRWGIERVYIDYEVVI